MVYPWSNYRSIFFGKIESSVDMESTFIIVAISQAWLDLVVFCSSISPPLPPASELSTQLESWIASGKSAAKKLPAGRVKAVICPWGGGGGRSKNENAYLGRQQMALFFKTVNFEQFQFTRWKLSWLDTQDMRTVALPSGPLLPLSTLRICTFYSAFDIRILYNNTLDFSLIHYS